MVEAIEIADRVARRVVVVAVVLPGFLARSGIPHLDKVLPVLEATKRVLGFAPTVHEPSLAVRVICQPIKNPFVKCRHIAIPSRKFKIS